MRENSYIFETDEIVNDRNYFVVICYDIYDNKRRNKFAKFLQRYALRVQRSVFEGELSKKKYASLIAQIGNHINDEDNVRVYRITGNGDIKVWGNVDIPKTDDIIII